MYLSFGTSVSLLAASFCEWFEDFHALVVLSAILLLIKSPVASDAFWIALFEAVFIASVVDFLALSRIFDHIYCLNFYPCFLQKRKIFRRNWISHFYKKSIIWLVELNLLCLLFLMVDYFDL